MKSEEVDVKALKKSRSAICTTKYSCKLDTQNCLIKRRIGPHHPITLWLIAKATVKKNQVFSWMQGTHTGELVMSKLRCKKSCISVNLPLLNPLHLSQELKKAP